MLKLLVVYDNSLASYESHYDIYRTLVDENVGAASILVTSINDRFSADTIEFEYADQI